MRNILKTTAILFALVAVALSATSRARADALGAAAGAGTGLVVAGPPGAVVGGVIGAVFGNPWWGPPRSRYACWVDYDFRRHCRRMW